MPSAWNPWCNNTSILFKDKTNLWKIVTEEGDVLTDFMGKHEKIYEREIRCGDNAQKVCILAQDESCEILAKHQKCIMVS